MTRTTLSTTDLVVSDFALGTGMFGSGVPEEAARQQMDLYVQGGGNVLDAARVYGTSGQSEQILGRWMEDRGCRNQVVLVTKGAHPLLDRIHQSRMSRREIETDLFESLEHLRTDIIDLYLLHRDAPEVPVEQIVEILEAQVAAGRIRWYGCSNWAPKRIRAAQQYARGRGYQGFSCNQLNYSLAAADPDLLADNTQYTMDRDALELHRSQLLPAMAYAAMAQGYFQKRFRGEWKTSTARQSTSGSSRS